MPGYTKTQWQDGENKYDIKDQSDNVINSNIKLVYKGIGGTPVSAFNLQKLEDTAYYSRMLDSDGIAGTSPYYTIDPTFGDITKVEHKDTGNLTNIIRTDAFIYTRTDEVVTKIVETRTLITGETKTYTYNFDSSGNLLPGGVS